MAEPLKNSFGPDVPVRVADAIEAVFPAFDRAAFLEQALDGFEELELTARARRISDALAETLPEDRGTALSLIVSALGPEIAGSELTGMDAFFYLPYVFFVAEHGLDHFEEAMHAQYELTKRFTAEFSIRAFIERHPDETLKRLEAWTADPNVHVRRLVSEGTRPRLPWAGRLRRFQDDPTPVLALLERLKDDPEEYVRRSVANNLNDIAKDHPDVVVEVARRWWNDGSEERRKLVRHGLRTLIKTGHPDALSVLGYGADSPVRLHAFRCEPPEPHIGDRVRMEAELTNPSECAAGALVDLVVHFVKASGETRPKVFKGAESTIEPGGSAVVKKTVSLAQHTTRKHYPGVHRVEVMINGAVHAGGSFTLLEAR